MLERVELIKPALKSRVLYLYMNRQKFFYTVKFLLWLITFRGEGYEYEQIQEM